MSNRSTHRLRALFLANPSFDLNDPRSKTLWGKFKQAYSKIPAPDRHPDRLEAALARAMATLTTSS